MRLIDKVFTGIAVTLLFVGIASIESTPLILPLLMILGGGAWLVYAANAYKWDA